MTTLNSILESCLPHDFSIVQQVNQDELIIRDNGHDVKFNISINIAKVWIYIDKNLNSDSIFKQLINYSQLYCKQYESKQVFLWDKDRLLNKNNYKSTAPNAISIESKLIHTANDQELLSAVKECVEIFNNISSFYVDMSELEGGERKSIVKKYERSKVLRNKAIEIHGIKCKICGFSFESVYGGIGVQYIHIHHLEMLSGRGEGYVDPKTDLIPVCPNCHAMLHTQNPPLTPEQLKKKIKS